MSRVREADWAITWDESCNGRTAATYRAKGRLAQRCIALVAGDERCCGIALDGVKICDFHIWRLASLVTEGPKEKP